MRHIHIVSKDPDDDSFLVNALRNAGFIVTVGSKTTPADYIMYPSVSEMPNLCEGQLQKLCDMLESANTTLSECRVL